MLNQDKELLRWLEQGQRSRITFGQLGALLALRESPSIADLHRGHVSQAVNARQKLVRLERALETGPLTQSINNRTQLSAAGLEAVAEFHSLCTRLREIGIRGSLSRTTISIGAGDTLIQTAIGPVLGRLAKGKEVRWVTRNLRAADICQQLREGKLTFGLIRSLDFPTVSGLMKVREYSGSDLTLIAPLSLAEQPTVPKVFQMLHENKIPLLQQGTSWSALRERINQRWNTGRELAELEPAVQFETHAQAVIATNEGDGWCVVPTLLARTYRNPKTIQRDLKMSGPNEEIALVVSEKHIGRDPIRLNMLTALRQQLGIALRTP